MKWPMIQSYFSFQRSNLHVITFFFFLFFFFYMCWLPNYKNYSYSGVSYQSSSSYYQSYSIFEDFFFDLVPGVGWHMTWRISYLVNPCSFIIALNSGSFINSFNYYSLMFPIPKSPKRVSAMASSRRPLISPKSKTPSIILSNPFGPFPPFALPPFFFFLPLPSILSISDSILSIWSKLSISSMNCQNSSKSAPIVCSNSSS